MIRCDAFACDTHHAGLITTGQPHLAIRVADFELAQAALHAKGIELEAPILQPEVKLAFLKPADPAGCRVHIVWRP